MSFTTATASPTSPSSHSKPAPPSPNLAEEIHRAACVTSVPEIAQYLQDHLGQKITAYLAGLEDQKMVGKWTRSQAKPRQAAEHRLREAYQATRWLTEAYSDETAQAWFLGTNSILGRAPAAVLRSTDDPEVTQEVVDSAQSFVAETLGWRYVEAQEEQEAEEAALLHTAASAL